MKRIFLMAILLTFMAGADQVLARIWTDSSGKHTIDAELVAYKKGWVRLQKPDGTLISVPLTRLSEADHEFVKEYLRRAADTPTAPQPATPEPTTPEPVTPPEPTTPAVESPERSGPKLTVPEATTPASAMPEVEPPAAEPPVEETPVEQPPAVDLSAIEIDGNVEWDKMMLFGSGKDKKPDMIVSVVLRGKPAAEAIAFGLVQLKSIVDAAGTTLTPKAPKYAAKDPTKFLLKVDRGDSFFAKHPDGGVRVPLRFAQPVKASTKLAVVEGSMKLKTGGTPQIVIVEGPASGNRREIDDEVLKTAGIDLVVDPQGQRSVAVEISGNHEAVEKLQLLDARGRDLQNGISTASTDDSTTITLMSGRSIPANAQLRITVRFGAQEVDVPFRLTNLKVPPVPKASGGLSMPF